MSESSDPIVRGIVNKMYGESEGDDSAPTSHESPKVTESATVIYVWQFDDPTHGWNVIGVMTPQGRVLPMVTSQIDVAWQAMEVAQAHATKTGCQARLMAFSEADVLAILDPEPET